MVNSEQIRTDVQIVKELVHVKRKQQELKKRLFKKRKLNEYEENGENEDAILNSLSITAASVLQNLSKPPPTKPKNESEKTPKKALSNLPMFTIHHC
jgi:hypothetical protein